MAVMGVAAIAGMGATAAGVEVATLAWVAVGATVVGAVTGNKTLTKIGAGLSLGTAIGSAAGFAPTATTAPTGAELAKDGTAIQSGEATNAAAADGTSDLGVGSASAGPNGYQAEAPAGAEQAPPAAEQAPPAAADQSPYLDATAATQPMAAPPVPGAPAVPDAAAPAGAQTAAVSVAPGTSYTAPSQPIGQLQQPVMDGPAVTPAASGQPASTVGAPTSADPTGTNNPGQTTIQQANDTAAQTARDDVAAQQAAGKAMANPDSYWKSIQDWWNGLTPQGKLAVGQIGSGLVSGLGKGAADYMSESRKYDYLENERNYQRANLSAAGMPVINVRPKGLLSTAKV